MLLLRLHARKFPRIPNIRYSRCNRVLPGDHVRVWLCCNIWRLRMLTRCLTSRKSQAMLMLGLRAPPCPRIPNIRCGGCNRVLIVDHHGGWFYWTIWR